MPTYVYECEACGAVFEVEQRITEEPLKEHDCEQRGRLRRLITSVGLILTGQGGSSSSSGSCSPGGG
ncbi:MAG: hypothetical protein N2109_12485 [Fimbriimonadales bacterium]|nr:hypothetical protein [Fimbriimonadales bacterium]